MILLSRFLGTFWIEPNAKKFFAKYVPKWAVEYSHLLITIVIVYQFREAAHIANGALTAKIGSPT